MEGYLTSSKRNDNSKLRYALAAIVLVSIIGLVYASSQSLVVDSLKLSDYELSLQEFTDFSIKFSKQYATDAEFVRRFKIYRDNASYIRIFNLQSLDWTLGLNEFSDLTSEEFVSMHLTYDASRKEINEEISFHNGLGLPATVDWLTYGAVTGIKNEGSCGACWAFSTTGAVEGAWMIAGNPLVSLSEQQLIDCSSSYGNFGCSGGYMDTSFKYIVDYGITSEANYPYKGVNEKCNATAQGKPVARISGYVDVTPKDLNSLMAAVAQQPVSVIVDATTWSSYSGGVVTSNCGTQQNFAAVITGYNTVSSPNYWKVKNIWGTSWGQAGYISIGMSSGNGLCGINLGPSYPKASNK